MVPGIRKPNGRLDVDRLMCASVALGGGAVWAMHFIGMVAYQTPTHMNSACWSRWLRCWP
jgi:NO-binding membrane sensor protein with MHYT domain